MDLGDFGMMGNTLLNLATATARVYAYMRAQRDAGGEYDERFRALLGDTKDDVHTLFGRVVQSRDLCYSSGINVDEPGGARRIDYRLHWTIAQRQRRLLKKIDHLVDEIEDSIAGITAVIACFTGMTSGTDEPGSYIPAAEGYEEDESVHYLLNAERALRDVLANEESTLAAFFDTALDFLDACDRVLQAFSGGIGVRFEE